MTKVLPVAVPKRRDRLSSVLLAPLPARVDAALRGFSGQSVNSPRLQQVPASSRFKGPLEFHSSVTPRPNLPKIARNLHAP